jgi:hypothetical protein
LFLPKHLFAYQYFNTGLIIVIKNFISLSLGEINAKVISVTLVNVQFALHLSDMIVNPVLFLFFLFKPLLMALFLDGLQGH